MIEIQDLSFSYYDKEDAPKALKKMSLTVKEGERVGIVGANGAGKSTFLRLLVGLETSYRGRMMIDNLVVDKKNMLQIRKLLGYVFQDAESQMFLSTVRDNVAFGPTNYGVKGEDLKKEVDSALERLHISHLADRPIFQLSGGEKKLASIATVLSMEPKTLLFDEPTVALDPRNRRNLIDIINELPQTKLIASHDLDFILDTCDRVLLFYRGEIVADGECRTVLTDEETMEQSGLELPLSLQKRG